MTLQDKQQQQKEEKSIDCVGSCFLIAFLVGFVQICIWFFSFTFGSSSLICSQLHFYNVQVIPKSYRFQDPIGIIFSLELNGQEKLVDKSCEFVLSASVGGFYTTKKISFQSVINSNPELKNFKIDIQPIMLNLEQGVDLSNFPNSLILKLVCGGSKQSCAESVVPLSMEMFTSEILHEIKDINHTVNLLVTGEVGSGKSTTINSFFSAVHPSTQTIAMTLDSTRHVSTDVSRFKFEMFDYATKKEVIVPITITDTVGVSSSNYNVKESAEFLLKGGKPNIMAEEQIFKKQLDYDTLKNELQMLSVAVQAIKMSVEEESLLTKYINLTKSPTRKAEAEEIQELKLSLLKFKDDDLDWKTYFERRSEIVNYKLANFSTLKEKEQLFNKKSKELNDIGNEIKVMSDSLSKERHAQRVSLTGLEKQVHGVVFIVTHATIQSTSSELYKNLKAFVLRSIEAGHVPIVGVTKLQSTNVDEVRKEVATNLGVPVNNVYEIKANLQNRNKTFEVDKRSYEVFLNVLRRAKQFIKKKRIADQ